MAITSPFKKTHHSRESSREEPHPLTKPLSQVRPKSAKQQQPPAARTSQTLKKSDTVTSSRSTASNNSISAAQQYESDRARLIKYCFSSYGDDGVLKDSYITHVRIVEDAAYPGIKPPPSSPPSNKKHRVLCLSVKSSGEVYLHKGRENKNGSFQIGSSWSLNTLRLIARESYSDTGFLVRLAKDYYWETLIPKARQVFVTSLVRVYRKFKNGLIPQLVNWDLELFGLDVESYKIFLNKETLDEKPAAPAAAIQPNESQGQLQVRAPLAPITAATTAAAGAIPSGSRSNSASSKKPPSSQNDVFVTPTEHSLASSSRQASIQERSVPNLQSDVPPRRPSEVKVSNPPVSLRPPVPNSNDEIARKDSYSSTEHPYRGQVEPVQRENETPTLTVDEPVGHSTEQSIEQSELERDITRKMSNLGLDENPVLKNNAIPLRGDLPSRDPILPSSAETDTNSLNVTDSATGSSNRSIKDIEIVAHRKSLIEYQQEAEEEEQEEEEDVDDITDLYQGNSFEEPQSAIESEVSIRSDGDYSFEDSYGASQEHIMVTPATIKANNQSDDEYDDLNEVNSVEVLETPRLVIRKDTKRDRGNTITSALDTTVHDNGPNSSFDEIFDTVDWDENDDADTLTFKLMKELADTQYETVKYLIEVKEKSSSLQHYSQNIVKECDNIGPLFDYFAVELSGLVGNIQHIENEGQGLQIETINKKNLWKDLNNILETVSVDDTALQFLLNADIDKNIESIEPILADLQSAIVAIRGSNKDEEDLGDMKALRERRRNYETVISKFLKKLNSDLELRFRYVLKGLIKNHEINQVSVRRSLAKLMVYTPLSLFTKDISDGDFDELLGTWEGSANNFIQTVLGTLENDIVQLINKGEKFSLANPACFKEETDVSLTRKIAQKGDNLRARLGLADDSTNSSNKSNVENKERETINHIFSALEALEGHVILQQDFLLNFFHVSREDLGISKFIDTHPLHERMALLEPTVRDIETDLEITRETHNSLSMIFHPSLDSLIKALVHSLRNDQKSTMIVMLRLELFENKFSSSNQDFLLVNFKKLSDRLKVDWLRFIDIEEKRIEKSTLAPKKIREVSTAVKNFTRTIKFIEENYSETELIYGKPNETLESRELINSSYEQIGKAIIKNLNTQEEVRPSRFTLSDDSEDREKRNYLVNLIQNSNWLFETLTPLKIPALSSTIVSAREIFASSKDQFVLSINQGCFSKVSSFVTDVEGLLKETHPRSVDPSKRNAYSKAELTKILAGIDTKEINKTAKSIRDYVVQSFLSSTEHSDIQHQLIEKVWSAIQAQFVSTTISLEDIVAKYYRDVTIPFSKKDIIAAFNTSRIN